MNHYQHLAAIRELEQQLLSAYFEVESQYPEYPSPRRDQQKEIERLKREIAELLARKMRPILVFNIFENNKNFNCMAVLTLLTLTSTAPQTLFMTVLDSANGNAPIAGTLSALAYVPADPTQDIAVPDPVTPTDVDIHAVAPQGGTTVVATGNFVSTLTKTNPDGTTSPAFSGALPPSTLTIVNNVVVAVAMVPVLAFNQ
jgi:hypothetical protein